MQEVPTLKDIAVPVQGYLISGKDLRRKVVNGMHPGETPEGLLESLTCSSHQMISARYMGSERTCLVTLQVPPSPPDRITYYGCILSSRPYCPAVIQVLQLLPFGPYALIMSVPFRLDHGVVKDSYVQVRPMQDE
ncbi:unnamed protein product [Ixodes persulcatus]